MNLCRISDVGIKYVSIAETPILAGYCHTKICDDYYYDCAKKYDWCECKTDEVRDYTCPLKQHTCGDLICTGDYNSCKKQFGDCDCGVTGFVKDLS